ncbi:hypothetical protein LTR10_010821 [Elasticomyces elasticus]|nr:hypothetical protein LTR10_010821 [Elasticomyces elasticus]
MPKRMKEADDPVQNKRKSKRLRAKNKDSTERAEQAQECKLFALPAELRNSIYEEVLIHDDDIAVTIETRIPALLQASKQLRAETHAMWHERNKFVHKVLNCDAALLCSWSRHMLTFAYDPDTSLHAVDMVGKPNWTNLMTWCKAVCVENCVSVMAETDDTFFGSVIASATGVALRFAEIKGRWEDCEKVLLELKHMAVVHNRAWS